MLLLFFVILWPRMYIQATYKQEKASTSKCCLRCVAGNHTQSQTMGAVCVCVCGKWVHSLLCAFHGSREGTAESDQLSWSHPSRTLPQSLLYASRDITYWHARDWWYVLTSLRASPPCHSQLVSLSLPMGLVCIFGERWRHTAVVLGREGETVLTEVGHIVLRQLLLCTPEIVLSYLLSCWSASFTILKDLKCKPSLHKHVNIKLLSCISK